ncbi:MAG: hypothetical protein AAF564_25435 [Bacteroidota bacterium]
MNNTRPNTRLRATFDGFFHLVDVYLLVRVARAPKSMLGQLGTGALRQRRHEAW